MIKCNTCNIEKDSSEFYGYKPTQKHKLGILKACKQCVREKQQRFRKENPDHYTSQANRRYILSKQRAVEYKGGKCQDCNGTFPLRVYDFHHLDPNEKDHKWTLGRTWERLKLELDKCILLCANCHRIRHHNDEV